MKATCVVCGCLVCTYKAVSSGFTSLSVCDHHSLVYVPKGLEVFPQRGIGRVVRQPAHKDFGEGSVFLKRCGMHDFQGSVHELMQKHWSAGEKTRGTLKVSLQAPQQQRPSISRTKLKTSLRCAGFLPTLTLDPSWSHLMMTTVIRGFVEKRGGG